MVRKYSQSSEKNFLLLITIIFILLSFYLIKGIFSLILYSFILSYFLYPVYSYFISKIKNERLSSIVTIMSVTVVLFIPLALLIYFLILSLIKLVVEYRVYLENPDILNISIEKFIEHFSNSTIFSGVNFSDYFSIIVSYILDVSKTFFSSLPIVILNFFIVMFITYYILVYNKKMLKTINEYLPLGFKKQEEILNNLAINLKVLFKGYFLTGVIQTLVALFGYLIFGVNNLLIVLSLTLFASLLPYIGTPLVWVPISIYMILTGNETGGIGLLIYGTLVISMVDNFLRPVLMSSKGSISPPLVFVGFVGGLLAFGISGIILGPIIISITSIFMRYLKENFEIKT